MSSEIKLAPSWYGKIPLEKGSSKFESINSTFYYGNNENDKYFSPTYSETKEFIANIKPYNKLPSLNETFDLDDYIRPIYKHFLNGSDFYKFYLKKVKNMVPNKIPVDKESQLLDIQSVSHVEISNKTGTSIIQQEDMLDEPIEDEDIEKYKTKGKKIFDEYADYFDDDYNVYSDFEAR